MSHRRPALILRSLLLLPALAAAGCGISAVTLTPHHLVEPTPANAPVIWGPNGTRTLRFQSILSGNTLTLPYDPILWRFTRLPCIHVTDGQVMLLDTGLIGPPLAVTLDVINNGRRPAHLDPSGAVTFAYIDVLKIAAMNVTDAPAWVQNQTFVLQFLGIPLYRASGWVMGDWLLRQAGYVAFDNSRREVTLGFADFAPDAAHTWQSFPSKRLPFLPALPINGVPMPVLADSGGGAHLILDPAQWQLLSPHLKVLGHSTDKYPTWGGFQKIDAYRVTELTIGSLKLPHQTVWVRQGQTLATGPTLGLGMLREGTMVWDYRQQQLWIGLPKRSTPSR